MRDKYILTQEQFSILSDAAEGVKSSRLCENKDAVNTLSLLIDKGLMSANSITDEGILALEPYRVRRAVFLAAGFGSRLTPVSLKTPKPLVTINGTRIIDTMLDALIKAGINEIYIVRGHLSEKFDQLLDKYPQLCFIDNYKYSCANNILSALLASDYFENAYILEADLFLYNHELIRKYVYASSFYGIPTKQSSDWCFIVKDGFIVKHLVGGDESKLEDGLKLYQQVGISYWTKEDAGKLYIDLQRAYNMPNGDKLYWEQTQLSIFPNDYKIRVLPCRFDDIIKIDTFEELKAIDKSYNTYQV